LLALLVGLLAQATVVSGDSSNILKADSMVGVPTGLAGAANAIRNVPGAGAPWRIATAKVALSTEGDLTVKVEGLVLDAGANAGSNPAGAFRAIVSCLTSVNTIVNVTTDPFPATTGPAALGGGNAKFEGVVALPHPCIAPIVFVTNANGSWFAATGG
jgi:hypothetical protein